MLTGNYQECLNDLPAKLSMVSILRAHQAYHTLFNKIGYAKINHCVEPPSSENDPSIYRGVDSVSDEGILICPMMLKPVLWGWNDCDSVLSDAGRVWGKEDGYHIEVRDYALLNELKWFLIFKHITDLEWEGSHDEARTVATIKIFATLLHLAYRAFLHKDLPSGMEPTDIWDFVNVQVDELFASKRGSNNIPVMDKVLKSYWHDIIKAAKRGRASS